MSVQFDTIDIDKDTTKEEVNDFLRGCQMFFIQDIGQGIKRLWASFQHEDLMSVQPDNKTIQ